MSESGHAAVEFAMAVAVLMLPVALVVTAFGPWSETRVWAEATAAEAARAAAIDLDQLAGESVVVRAISARGLDPDGVRLGWCGGTPGPINSTGGTCVLARGSVVTAQIEVWTPLISTPWGAVGGVWVPASHAEPVDLYRSLE